MDPLISVLMPCYNMAGSLPRALGSLLAQTYENWECILVDDGSKDNPHEIVATLHDKRFKYIRLEKNMGRGFARGLALERSMGDFVSMLDADDWMFPERLETQVELLRAFPKAALVDSGVAVVDSANELRGVIRTGTGIEPTMRGPLGALWRLPVAAFASCMIRGNVARQAGFDSLLRRNEDMDFLYRVLLNQSFVLWSGLAYVYTGFKRAPLPEILSSYRLAERIFGMYSRRFPFSSRLLRAHLKIKAAIRKAIYSWEGERLLALRYETPTLKDRTMFAAARQEVADFVERVF
jgi:glycosyltransferase involved in cell wall biosynthesis